LFPRYTGPMFDAITPAVIVADQVAGLLLDPERAARVVEQHAVDPSLPGLEAVIDAVYAASFGAAATTPYQQEVKRAVERVVVNQLIDLAGSASMPQVRAIASYKLQRRGAELARANGTGGEGAAAHAMLLAADIKRFLEHPAPASPASMPAPAGPPGAPIGEPAMEWLRRWMPSCPWEQ
jgi:hypothetical protein